jgi:aspartyl-tRNA(Asn)/glutamyl-tRNA(Gln) amidotransferase subunit B
VPQRSKEFAEDYRYFPEPDLPPLSITASWTEQVLSRMPELPDQKRIRFREQYRLSDYDARVLSETRPRGDFFEETVSAAGDTENAKAVANWVTGDLARLLNANGTEIQDSQVTPNVLAEIIALQESGTISGKTAKDVLERVFRVGGTPRGIVDAEGLAQIESSGEIDEAVERVIAVNERAVTDYRGGKDEAIKFLVGQVMKETRGRARPDAAADLLREKLGRNP